MTSRLSKCYEDAIGCEKETRMRETPGGRAREMRVRRQVLKASVGHSCCPVAAAGASQGHFPLSSSLDSSTRNLHWLVQLGPVPSLFSRHVWPPSIRQKDANVRISILSDPSLCAYWLEGLHTDRGRPYLIGLQRRVLGGLLAEPRLPFPRLQRGGAPQKW